MRIDNSLVHKMPTNIVPRPKETPGDREPDGDADDRARAVARQPQPIETSNYAAGKKINILA